MNSKPYFNLSVITSCVITLMSLTACGHDDSKSKASNNPQPTNPTPKQETQQAVSFMNLDTSPVAIGETLKNKITVLAPDKSNPVTSLTIVNTNSAGAVPTITSDGEITWTPNDADLNTKTLQVKATTKTGQSVTTDIPVTVMKKGLVFESVIDPAKKIYSDAEGVFAVEVAVKEGVTNPGSFHVYSYTNANGHIDYMIEVDQPNNVAAMLKEQPLSPIATNEINGAITTQNAPTRSDAPKAANTGLRNLPSGKSEWSEYGVEAIGSEIVPRIGSDTFQNFQWNFYTLRNNIPSNSDLFSFKDYRLIQIDSSCVLSENNCHSEKAPVIFIHGFLPDNGNPFGAELGGGNGTWKDAAKIAINSGHDVFEFRWVTHMRFEEAAGQLTNLINTVAKKTGKKPIIIAHSFGGIVSHLALSGQGIQWNGNAWVPVKLGTKNIQNPSDVVQQLVTLGSPVGGIYNGQGKSLPGLEWGRDSDDITIANCQAITCLQAGKSDLKQIDQNVEATISRAFNTISSSSPVLPSAQNRNNFNIAETIARIGKITTGIPQVDAIQPIKHNVPTLAVVGISESHINEPTGNYTKSTDSSEGDGLISLRGQMMPEDLKQAQSSGSFVLNKNDISWNNVMYIKPNARTKIYANQNIQYIFVPGLRHSAAQYITDSFTTEAGAFDNTAKAYDASTSQTPYDYKNVYHPLSLIIKNFLNKSAEPYAVDKVVGKYQLTSKVIAKSNTISTAASDIIPFQVEIYNNQTNERIGRSYNYGRTNADGTFSVDLNLLVDQTAPDFDRSKLRAMITVGDNVNYQSLTVQVTNMNSDEIIVPDINIFKKNSLPGMVNFSGKVIDGQTNGTPLADAWVKLRMGRNIDGADIFWVNDTNTSRFVKTDTNGNFFISQLRPGVYSALVHKTGYVDEIQGQVIVSENGQATFSLLKVLPASEASVTLRWGTSANGNGIASDLDSHLLRFGSTNNNEYHIYYSNRNADTDNLDRDDTDYEGPETVTFTPKADKNYMYYVHNYTGGSTTIPQSYPNVILRINGQAYRYDLPVSSGNSGRYWHVFDVKNGQVIPCTINCIQDNAPTTLTTQSHNVAPLPQIVASLLTNLPIKR